ncbi:MAG TPA: ABC transporter ATP-binding protein [Gemmatimonadota bacterium]|nr:ABC transporter ATP-binding protein [Gemmatimonadota bacterium]
MAADPPSSRFTIYDLKATSDRGSQIRRTPSLAWEALRLAWRAGPRPLVLVTALQFVSAGLIALQLLVGRHVLDHLMAPGSQAVGSLVPGLALLVGASVLLGAVVALAAHQQRFLTELVGNHTFERIIDVASSVDLASFEDPDFYDQLMRARTSAISSPIGVVGSINVLVMSLLTSVGIGIALMTMHWSLLPLVAVAAVPVLIATLYNSRQAYDFEYQWTPRGRERMYLLELLVGKDPAKEVRVFGASSFLRRRFDALTQERVSRLRDFLRQRLKVALTGTIGGALGAAIALGTLVWLVVTNRINVATAVTAGVAMQLLISRFSAMTRGLGSLVEAGMFLDDYRTFLSQEVVPTATRSANDPARPARVPVRFEGLRIERVSFTYPKTEALVLDDISLEVDPGEVIALVGENGSGKTTLVKLICQLYRPQAGRILWNGVDASQLDPDILRNDFTVIFQDFIKYHLTVSENIVMGRIERPHGVGEVTEAARHASAHDFIARLPHGYETRLGRQFYGGHELSVGQWQRLALARAFFRGGSFLVLDEPTAALDPRAEYELFSQMRALTEGRSVLLVSHRFSSVRNANRIYVLHSGRVIESGTHAQLMALGGTYAELFTLQAAAYLGEVEHGPSRPSPDDLSDATLSL